VGCELRLRRDRRAGLRLRERRRPADLEIPGAGADVRLLSRNSAYRDFPNVTRNVREFRLYVKVFPRRAPEF